MINDKHEDPDMQDSEVHYSEARKLVEDWIAEATKMATKTPASKKGGGYWDGRREGLELALGVIVHYGI